MIYENNIKKKNWYSFETTSYIVRCLGYKGLGRRERGEEGRWVETSHLNSGYFLNSLFEGNNHRCIKKKNAKSLSEMKICRDGIRVLICTFQTPQVALKPLRLIWLAKRFIFVRCFDTENAPANPLLITTVFSY